MNLNLLLKNAMYPAPINGEAASIAIRELLRTQAPAMIARFGSVEIKGVLYPTMPWPIRRLTHDRVFSSMENNAGFFSVSEDALRKFSKQMIEDMQLLDVLGSWRIEEKFLLKNFRKAVRIELKALEPYLSNAPWSEILEGRKVLVVHPFNTTIERQYREKRDLIFSDKRVLPQFGSLQTIKAVQTIAGNNGKFDDWFQALDSMKTEIETKDFDIAILGCGAYGFPLAAHIKRLGKQAVHLGGATQILFGIKGLRWDNHPVISRLYNEHWVRPAPEDIPDGAAKVENGCYW